MSAVPNQSEEFLTGNEAYKSFNAKTYLAYCYSLKSDEFQMMMMQILYKAFNSGEHERGGRLLDIASGPSIMQVMSASKYYTDITLSDYAQLNRVELQAWKSRDEDAFDWTRYFENAAKLESTSAAVIADRMHERVTSVLPCDIHNTDPLSPHQGEPYDCILSNYTLEATCNDEQSFQQSVKNLSNMLCPGGFLVLSGALDSGWYKFGEKTESGEKIYYQLRLTEDMLRRAVEQAGCTVLDFAEVTTPNLPRDKIRAIYCVRAVKHDPAP